MDPYIGEKLVSSKQREMRVASKQREMLAAAANDCLVGHRPLWTWIAPAASALTAFLKQADGTPRGYGALDATSVTTLIDMSDIGHRDRREKGRQ